MKASEKQEFESNIVRICEENLTRMPGQRDTVTAIVAKLVGVRATEINDYLSEHATGQSYVSKGAIAIPPTGRMPAWAIDLEASKTAGKIVRKRHVPVSVNYVSPVRELVPITIKSGITEVDETLDAANKLVHAIPGKSRKIEQAKSEIRQTFVQTAEHVANLEKGHLLGMTLMERLADSETRRADSEARRADMAEQLLQFLQNDGTKPTIITTKSQNVRRTN